MSYFTLHKNLTSGAALQATHVSERRGLSAVRSLTFAGSMPLKLIGNQSRSGVNTCNHVLTLELAA